MKIRVESLPAGLVTTEFAEADIIGSDSGGILSTHCESFNYRLDIDFSRMLALHYQVLKCMREDRTRGVVVQIIPDPCENCPKQLIEIIWGAGATMRVYQNLSKILQRQLSSQSRLPVLRPEES